MPVDGARAAELLLARLAQCKTSPTVLFLLKLRPKNLGATELGCSLLRLCRELDVVQSPNSEFYISVKEKSAELAPIEPRFFVVNRKKADAVKNFREELSRRVISGGSGADPFMYIGAFMPFCFQCLCAKTDDSKYPAKSLFFIFAAPEDGMRMMLEVFRSGSYFFDGRLYVFSQIYEHRLGDSFAPVNISAPDPVERSDNRLGYILLDWEVEEGKVQGRLSPDEIRALCERFPTWFYEKLCALGLVDPDAYVTAVFKQKSRPIDGGRDYKHSAHVVFEIMGVPATELKWVCDRVFADQIRDLLSQSKKARNFSPVPDSVLRDAAWLGADLATMRGRTGYAVMFSRKNAADTPPRLLYRAVYCQGRLVVPTPKSGIKNPRVFHPTSAPHDLATLSEADALSLLYNGLCSVPKFYTARFSVSAEESFKAQQSRTAAKHQAAFRGVGGCLLTSPQGAGGSSSSVLPAWMLSTIVNSGVGGYAERRDSATTYYTQLMGLLGEEDKAKAWVAVHIGGGAAVCPQCLSEDPPRMIKHRSNGVIVAFVADPLTPQPLVVYARCTTCSVSHTTNPRVERLMRRVGTASPWVILSKEGVEALVEETKCTLSKLLVEARKGITLLCTHDNKMF